MLVQQSRSATGSQSQARFRGGLVAVQLALALTLLTGAGVLMASFHRLQQLDLGFRVDRMLTFDLNLPGARYDAERRAVFQEELADRLETIPGVTAAGGISFLPATANFHPWSNRILSGSLAGTWVQSGSGALQQRFVSGDYFAALEIPVLAGRTFEAQDDANAPFRAVVSANFAEQAFPNMPLEDVVGQRIAMFCCNEHDIIGVVGDVPLDARGSNTLIVYYAHRQWADNRN